MRIVEKINMSLNEEFRVLLPEAFEKEFCVKLVTEYDFLSGRLISTREDGADFRNGQEEFISAYSAGYEGAWSVVRKQEK